MIRARLVLGAVGALAFVVSLVVPAAGSAVAAPVPLPVADAGAVPEIPGLDPAVADLAGIGELGDTAAPDVGSLTEELAGLASMMDVPLDEGAIEDAVQQAELGAAEETALAQLVGQLGLCTADTQAALEQTSHRELLLLEEEVRPGHIASSRACAVALRGLAETSMPALGGGEAGAEPLTIWPLLSYSPDPTRDDVYVEDFMLSMDAGGDDTYLNNQGSNMIDIKRSVSNPAVRYPDTPARGCFETYPDSVSGRVVEGPNGERVPSFDGPECVPTAALFVDMAGNDTYGQLEEPVFPDTECSAEPSVHRMTTIGAGVEGVGMLIDVDGDDSYAGRTVTMGAGHLGGIGLHEDRAGDDHYLAMRNAQGLGLLGGTGILRDDAGDDVYDYYMPAPLDGDAPLHADGSGGVADDSGLATEIRQGPHNPEGVGGRCDNLERSLQGVGILAPAVGIHVDSAGDDSYRAQRGFENQDGGFPLTDPLGLPFLRLAHGSQGSGFLGGVGGLFDLGGNDSYLNPDRTPQDNRRDGMLDGPKIQPDPSAPGFPDNGQPLDASVFFDAE